MDVATRQVAAGWRVHLAGPVAISARVPAGTGAELHTWDARRSPGPHTPAEIRSLRDLIGRLAPGLVHLHSSKAGVAGRLALRGRTPTIFQPHAWSFEAVRGLPGSAARRWEVYAARWAHRVVCVSEAERERGRRAGINAHWEVIPNGVDLDVWNVATVADRDAARDRLNLPDGPIAVSVGRLSRQKGHDLLLDAWPRVRAAAPGARLFVVGEGPRRAFLEGRRAEAVHLVGPSDHVAEWLAAADVAVFPSRWEGMSLAMLEAMARARAVVTTEVSGAREAVRDDAGAVVPREDSPALARAVIVRLLDLDRAAAEGVAARRRVESTYTIDRVVASLDTLYRKLLGRGDHA